MKNIKQFETLPWWEVCNALIEMLTKLNIAGSTATYDLYSAVNGEWLKAKGIKNSSRHSHISIDDKARTIDIMVPSHNYTEEAPYYISWDRIDEDWAAHLGGKVWWTRELDAGLTEAIKMVKLRLKFVEGDPKYRNIKIK